MATVKADSSESEVTLLSLATWDGKPIRPSALLGIQVECGLHELFGSEIPSLGHGFTVEVDGERWRASLADAVAADDGSKIWVALQVEDRCHEPTTPHPSGTA